MNDKQNFGSFENKIRELEKKIAVLENENSILNNIINEIPDCIYWKDQNSVYLGCNRNFSRLLGLNSVEDIIGKTDIDLNWQYIGGSTNTFIKEDREVLSGEPIRNKEKTLLLPNGRTLIVLVSKLPIMDKNKPIGTIGYFTDVTLIREQHDKEKDGLKKLASLPNIYLQNVISNMPGSIYLKDKDGRFLACNQFVAEMAGVSNPDEVIGKSDYELVWSSVAGDIRKNDLEIMTSKKEKEFEEEVILSDGTKINMLTKKAPLFDGPGHVLGIIGVSIDITARKKAEKTKLETALSIKNKSAHITKVFFENITESLPQYVFWKDINSVYLGCNKNYSKIVGLKNPEDIIGKTDFDLNWQEIGNTAEFFQQGDRKTIAGKKIINQEEILVFPNGRKLITLVSKLPIMDGNQPVGIVGYFTDITAIREAQAKEKKAIEEAINSEKKAQGETELRNAVTILTGSIAHDLRTPITSIGMVGQAILKYLPELINGYNLAKEHKLIDGPIRIQKLNAIENSAKTLESTSEQMHEFINATLKTLSKSILNELNKDDLLECSIKSCLFQTLDEYPFYDGEEKLIRITGIDDFVFLGNQILMFRVLTNLIKNSLYQIQKNNKGHIEIDLSNNNEFNYLKLKDTAGGAPPDIVANIFDGFKTTKKEGTGIGLAFCAKTMRDFGGDIKCCSEYGDYIEFTLVFPHVTKQP